jgi:hypothetical protein
MQKMKNGKNETEIAICTVQFYIVKTRNTEYTECWPCLLFYILLNKYFPAG